MFLSFSDYIAAAFHRRVRVPLLGALPANKMGLAAVVVAGLANPGFWLLGAALEIDRMDGVLVASMSTDGIDGSTDAAGATATGSTVRRAADHGLDCSEARADNDAYSVFGAFVMPMVALTLLLLNGRAAWVGESLRNRWWTSLALVIILAFFAWVGFPKLLTSLGLGS